LNRDTGTLEFSLRDLARTFEWQVRRHMKIVAVIFLASYASAVSAGTLQNFGRWPEPVPLFSASIFLQPKCAC